MFAASGLRCASPRRARSSGHHVSHLRRFTLIYIAHPGLPPWASLCRAYGAGAVRRGVQYHRRSCHLDRGFSTLLGRWGFGGAEVSGGFVGGVGFDSAGASGVAFGGFKSKNPVRSTCPARVSTSCPWIRIFRRRTVATLFSNVRDIESTTNCSLSTPDGVSEESASEKSAMAVPSGKM